MTERKALAAFELKDEGRGTFRATFSRFNVIDKHGDVTTPGAFTRGQQVRIMQWNHNWEAPPAGRGRIDFDGARAYVDGEFFLDTAGGVDTWKVVKRLGELAEWSYGFDITAKDYGDFGTPPRRVRFLRGLSVIECSPVTVGAGIGTGTDFVKRDHARLTPTEVLEIERERAIFLGVPLDRPAGRLTWAEQIELEAIRARALGVRI